MYDVIIMFIFKVYEAVNLNQLHQNSLLQHITHISLEAIDSYTNNFVHVVIGHFMIITFILYRYTVN